MYAWTPTEGTDCQGMSDFHKSGWRIGAPGDNTIPWEVHTRLLEESLIKYGDIWKSLANK